MAELTVNLPKLHAGQSRLYHGRTRLNSVRFGRRCGKTVFLEWLAAKDALDGKQVGVFAPENKQLAEPWDHLVDMLQPVIKNANKNDAVIKLVTGGKIDFWPLNDNELAGRGRSYDLVLMDEAGFTKSPQMMDIWFKSIKPTMLTTLGTAWVFSTPNGIDPQNFFYAACNDPNLGFKEFHAPSITNPLVSPEEIERERLRNVDAVFRQEFLAEWVDWSGQSILSVDKMLVDGKPVDYPAHCDGVFAVIDTAIKGGKEHDGTAVVYFAFNKFSGTPLVVLDWDVVQIDGAMMDTWIPSVFKRCDELAKTTKARSGVLGTFIEDSNAGTILLQHGRSKGWPTVRIDSKLTSMGKDERVVSVSAYIHQEMVKMSEYAFNKTMLFKGFTMNHLLSQIGAYRIGDKDAYKRADDLSDAFVYGVAVACGDSQGF